MLLLLGGCRTTLPPTDVLCPSPELPQCRAVPWQGIVRDTVPQTERPYWEIASLEGLASPERDELALTLLSDSSGWATVAEVGRQHVGSVRLSAWSRAFWSASWQSELEQFGMPTGAPDHLLLAGRFPDDHPARIRLIAGRLQHERLLLDAPLHWSSAPDSEAWESQPALSPDGSVLFFAADYSNSYGGTDIYFAVRRPDGSWAGPYNCGPSINTACNELTPSVSRDGRWLLFASNGHTSRGGYDLFAAAINPFFWGWVHRGMPPLAPDTGLPRPWFEPAQSLGSPPNTAADELSPSAPGHPDSLLIWSSNLRGSFDLYVMQRREPLATPLGPAPLRRIEIRGQVRQRETQRPLPNAEVRAHSPGNPIPVATARTDTAGNYRLSVPARTELELIAQAGEVFFHVERIRTGDVDTLIAPLEVPARFFLRLNFPFDRYDAPYPFVLDTNGQETTLTWNQALDLLAENLRRYRSQLHSVLLIGHTDDIGSPEYNRWLGQKRVEFVIRELVRRGVPRELLRGESAGQSQLLPRLPGEPLERWRKRCRRVELTKLLRSP